MENQASEIGIEDFSIANIQNSKEGLLEDDFNVNGTAGYECDQSRIINMSGVANSWIRNINTYKPEGNADYHILSNGILLAGTKNVTVDNCTIEYPQYRGANGNGYLYQIEGNDNLISNSKAIAGGHNFTYANFSANGNVLYNRHAGNSYKETDFHMYFSMANLIDTMTLDGDAISTITRRGMQFLKSKYAVTLPYGTAAIPKIDAEALSPDAKVTITQPTAVNGAGKVTIENKGASKEYLIECAARQ